jgi:hypothetical protein
MLHFEHVLQGEDIIYPPLDSAALSKESNSGANGKGECRTDDTLIDACGDGRIRQAITVGGSMDVYNPAKLL